MAAVPAGVRLRFYGCQLSPLEAVGNASSSRPVSLATLPRAAPAGARGWRSPSPRRPLCPSTGCGALHPPQRSGSATVLSLRPSPMRVNMQRGSPLTPGCRVGQMHHMPAAWTSNRRSAAANVVPPLTVGSPITRPLFGLSLMTDSPGTKPKWKACASPAAGKAGAIPSAPRAHTWGTMACSLLCTSVEGGVNGSTCGVSDLGSFCVSKHNTKHMFGVLKSPPRRTRSVA